MCQRYQRRPNEHNRRSKKRELGQRTDKLDERIEKLCGNEPFRNGVCNYRNKKHTFYELKTIRRTASAQPKYHKGNGFTFHYGLWTLVVSRDACIGKM